MPELKNIFSPYQQTIFQDLESKSAVWSTKPKINCVVLEGSRLFYLFTRTPTNTFLHLKTGSVYNNSKNKTIVFWQYLGNNLYNIHNLLNLKLKNCLVIIDDAYEGLLTEEKIDFIETKLCNLASDIIFATSNFKIQKENVYHVHYHLMNQQFDEIIPAEHIIQDHFYNRSKKFLCLNNIPRIHRLKIVKYFIGQNLLTHSHISCKRKHIADTIVDLDDWVLKEKKIGHEEILNRMLKKDFFDEEFINSEYFSQEEIQILDQYLPLLLDQTNDYVRQNYQPAGEQFYYDSYWSIVTERDFYDNRFLGYTEKVLKCFLFKHPFIVVGLPYTLQFLKDLGFITFESVVDESYDLETDPDKRFSLIQKEITKLANLNYSEHLIVRKELDAILEYNRTLYLRLNETVFPNKIVTAIQNWWFR